MGWSVDAKAALLLATIFLGSSGIVANDEFVPGAVPIRQPDNQYPILYSSIIPVLFKFRLPTWDSVTTKIQFWSKHNNCTESDHYDDGYPCPILHHMNYLVEYFTQNMTSWKHLLVEKLAEDTRFLQNPSLLWDASLCSNFPMEPQFKGMQATADELGKYIQALSQCTERNGKALNIKFVNLTSVAEYLEERYHYTFMSFTSDYWKRLGTAQEAVSLTSWSALQATLMTHQFMEAQKIVEAMQTCSHSRIPWTLIDSSSLKEFLTTLRNGFMEDSHDFAIPLEDISKYFQLPLTECIFGTDNTLVVTIKVPILPKQAAFKNYFVKYRPLPFVSQGKICSLWNGVDSEPFNVGFNGILPCHCMESDLFCKGWNTEGCSPIQQQKEECLRALAGDLEQEIVDSCQLKCRSINGKLLNADRQLDIVLQSNETDIVRIIPGYVNDTADKAAYVTCTGNKNMPIPLQDVGAYELSMPRNCSILIRKTYIPTNLTVSFLERVNLTHLMPYHWRGGVSVDSSDGDESGKSFIDNVEKLEGVSPKINLIASKVASLEYETSRPLNDIFLWLFVLMSLIMNVCLAVVVHQLYMWRKEQIYKANRLVYSISPDDDIQNFPIPGDQQTRPLCDADSL